MTGPIKQGNPILNKLGMDIWASQGKTKASQEQCRF